MSDQKKSISRYIVDFCLADKLPVWATLLGIVIGAVVTAASSFWIVPKINESLERQKIRTEFVIRNLDDLNARTRALVVDISELHSSILSTGNINASAIQKPMSKIAEMQWKAIELAIIFEQKNGRIIKDYQKSLEDVRVALSGIKSKDQLPASQEAVEKLSASTLSVIRELASLGGLRINSNVGAPKS